MSAASFECLAAGEVASGVFTFQCMSDSKDLS